jgi:integrase
VSYKGKRRKSSAPTQESAEFLEKQLLEELMYGISSEPKAKKAWTVKDAFNHCCDHSWNRSRSEGIMISTAKGIMNWFGPNRLLDDIDVELIDKFVAYLISINNADATINRKLAVVSKFFSEAVKRGRAKTRPILPRRKERKGRIRFITPEEEEQIIQLFTQWDKISFLDFLLVLVDTGMRRGELQKSLTVRDLDFKTGMISIWENKGNEPRSVPMTARVREILQRRSKIHPMGILFDYSNDWCLENWAQLRSVMGLAEDKEFVPHCLRHTLASRLAQRGVSMAVIQLWLGHKTISQTMRYSHLSPTNLKDAASVLEPETKLRAIK